MIITRTPLRISLGGGGTDLPSYYREAGHGFLIAAAITKYVYIAVHRNFDDDVCASTPRRARANGRRHQSSTLAHVPARDRYRPRHRDHVDGASPTVPARSSGSFTVGVLKALLPINTNS